MLSSFALKTVNKELSREKALNRLSEDQDLSMDWYFFGKGPVNFKEKKIAEELVEELEKTRRKVTELEEKNAELEKKSDELAQHNEALAQEARENHQKEGEIRRLAAAKPGIGELLSHMEHIPLLYHEIMTHFHRFKADNKEMVESSLGAEELENVYQSTKTGTKPFP